MQKNSLVYWSRGLRILVLSPTFLPVIGGAELVLWEVFRRLAERHHVLMLTPELDRKLLAHYKKNEYDYPVNFKVIRFKDKITLMSIRGHKILRGAIPPFSISAVFELKKAIKSFRPDVLNVHYTMPTGLAGAVANALWGLPTILTLNGRDVPGPGVPPLWKYWHRAIAKCCSNVTYVSSYCRDVIFGHDGPGVVTWNGVDFEKVNIDNSPSFRKRLGIQEKTTVLLAIQRLSKEKGVDVLIKSMEFIVKYIPDSLLLIGGIGPEESRLKEMAGKLGVSPYVKFVGFIEESLMSNFFNLCDLFLFHSFYETFGIVLAQAMAHGKAIVSVNNTAIPAVVGHGDCGLLVSANNPKEISEAVIKLIQNATLRNQMGKRGRERAITLFDWETVTAEYEKVFKDTLKR